MKRIKLYKDGKIIVESRGITMKPNKGDIDIETETDDTSIDDLLKEKPSKLKDRLTTIKKTIQSKHNG